MTKTKGSKSYTFSWVALDKHVLIVAVSSAEANHGAYIGAVKGEDYGVEALGVAESGSAVWPQLAEMYFKGFGSGPIRPFRTSEPYIENEPPKASFRLQNSHLLEVRRLDKHVLLVAVEDIGETWKAFIGAVKGEDYGVEAPDVVANGSEIPYEVARVCFEDLSRGPLKWHPD